MDGAGAATTRAANRGTRGSNLENMTRYYKQIASVTRTVEKKK